MSSRVHRAFPSSENAPLLVASSKSRIGQNTTKASNTTTLRDDDDNGFETSFSSSSAMIKRGGRAIGIIVAFFILGAGCVVGMSSRVSQKGVVEEGFVAKAKTTIVSSSNNNNNNDDDDDDDAFGTMRSSKPPPRKSSVREHHHQHQQKLGMELDGYDLDANAFGGDIWHVPFEYYKDTVGIGEVLAPWVERIVGGGHVVVNGRSEEAPRRDEIHASV